MGVSSGAVLTWMSDIKGLSLLSRKMSDDYGDSRAAEAIYR